MVVEEEVYDPPIPKVLTSKDTSTVSCRIEESEERTLTSLDGRGVETGESMVKGETPGVSRTYLPSGGPPSTSTSTPTPSETHRSYTSTSDS